LEKAVSLNRWAWFGIQVLVGALMLALLLYFADLASVMGLIFRADLGYVLMAALTFIIASVFVGYSLFILLERMGYSPPAFKTVMVSIAGQLISDLTPARTGYFVTPVLLGGELGVNFEDGMAAIVFTGAVQSFVTTCRRDMCCTHERPGVVVAYRYALAQLLSHPLGTVDEPYFELP